ncbi:MAG: hypothetical protein LC749_22200, partial [Actinobacteria bacterium]|nr:hypothetical protein [Actinomycetota bacterium]
MSQTPARDTDRLDKPRESQPTGGMRFTSQTGQHHDGTLDQLTRHPTDLIQVGGSRGLPEQTTLLHVLKGNSPGRRA